MTKTTSSPDSFDIGAVIQAPLADKEWLKKSVFIGLLMLIPFIGTLNLMGWSKEITKRRLVGDTTLPDGNLDYIGSGWRAFVSFLPLLLLGIGTGGAGGAAVGAVLGLLNGEVGAGTLIGGLVGMYIGGLGVATLGSIVKPAIDFLHIVDEERYAGVAFRRIYEVLRDGGMNYFLLFVTVMLGGFIAQFGMLAFIVGLFVTIPFAQAINGAAIAEFERVLRPKTAGFDLVGTVSAQSGSPFGVTI